MRAALYSRVSTDAQERDGTSLETQDEACTAYAATSVWQIVERIRDTASGFSLDRPGMERLRCLVRSGAVDVVLSHAVDRLSRNQNHIGVLFDEFQQAGVRLEFVSERFEDTAVGRFILAARAFIAEVEREKIVERTTRGKIARARSGRIPAATGRGIYGYQYNRESGRRDIDPQQAPVVRQTFERYAAVRSFSAVAGELNDAGVPAFAGGRWYPLTIRTMLINETYTGRTVYRRTQRTKVRDPKSGKMKNRVVVRPADEHIEIVGATPAIIQADLWGTVQRIIADPERIRRRPEGRFYELSTRTRCGICGSAMIGQTLTVKAHPYRYYRCRHVYDRNSGRSCSARYVRGPELEAAVWAEIKRLLRHPAVVLPEMQRANEIDIDAGELAQLEKDAARLAEREKRLVRLYSLGEMDEDLLREEIASIRQQRQAADARLTNLRLTANRQPMPIDTESVSRVCSLVGAWLDRAADDDRALVLNALQIVVEATSEAGIVHGILPRDPPPFITDDESCRCSSSGEYKWLPVPNLRGAVRVAGRDP